MQKEHWNFLTQTFACDDEGDDDDDDDDDENDDDKGEMR